MSLSQEFQDKVASITSNLKNTNDLTHILGKGLSAIIDDNLTGEQESIIKNHASATVFHDLVGYPKTTGEHITHTFSDPIGKSIMALNISKNPEDFLAALTTTQESLKSIIHNMPKIMGSNMPAQMGIVLNSYETVIQDVQESINSITPDIDNAEEIISNTKSSMISGIEYIAPLPDDFPEI